MDELFKSIHEEIGQFTFDGDTNYTNMCYSAISSLIRSGPNMTNCSLTTSEDMNSPNNLQIFFNILYSITSILALIGNVGVLIVQVWCYRSPPLQNLKKYLINLAVSDILFGVLCVPFMYTDMILGKWIFPHWLCVTAQFTQLLSVCVNSFTLMIIGIERYCAILYPFSEFCHQLQSYSYFLVALTWILGIGYTFVPIRHTNVEEMIGSNFTIYYKCNNFIGLTDTERRTINVTNFVVTFMIPALVLTVTYSAIVRNICKKTPLGPISRTIRQNAKSIRITLTIIILYGLCWMSVKVFILLYEFGIIVYFTGQQYIYMALHWLAMANSFVNPIVYTFSSERFRTDIRNKFKPTLKVPQIQCRSVPRRTEF